MSIETSPLLEIRHEDDYVESDCNIEDTKLGSKSIIWLFASMLCLLCVTSLNDSFIMYLTPAITSSFDSFDIGNVIDLVQTLLSILIVPLFGILMARFDTVSMVIVGVVFLSLGNYLQSISLTFVFYVIVGLFSVIGSLGIEVVFQVLLGEYIKIENRGNMITLLNLPLLFGQCVSILMMNWVKDQVGWRWVLKWNSTGVLVSGGLIIFILNHMHKKIDTKRMSRLSVLSIDFDNPKHSFKGLISYGLLVVSMSLLLIPISLSQKFTYTYQNPLFQILIALGVVSSICLMIWESKYSTSALLPLDLFKRYPIAKWSILCLIFTSMDAALNWAYLSGYLMISRDLNEFWLALIQKPYQVSWFAANAITGCLMKRVSRLRFLLIIGCALNSLGVALVIPARHPSTHISVLLLAETLIGFGAGMTSMCGQIGYQSVHKKHMKPITLGYFLSRNIGNALAGALATAVWTNMLYYYLTKNLNDPTLVTKLMGDMEETLKLSKELKPLAIEAFSNSQYWMSWGSALFGILSLCSSWQLTDIPLSEENNEENN